MKILHICALEIDKKKRMQIFASVVFLLIFCDFIAYLRQVLQSHFPV